MIVDMKDLLEFDFFIDLLVYLIDYICKTFLLIIFKGFW